MQRWRLPIYDSLMTTPTALRTKQLELVPPESADTRAITNACQDPLIQQWTTVPVPYTPEHAERFIAMTGVDWGSSPTWTIRTVDGPLIGMIDLTDEGAASAELGFWLTPLGRGRGYMHEAVQAVCEYGFTRMGLQRITWRAVAGNRGSAAVAHDQGFTFDGCSRLGIIHRGERFDGWVGSLIATDWPLNREHLERAQASWPKETFKA